MGLRLAVVDDDPDVLDAMNHLLASLQCETVAFLAAAEAADYLDRNKIDAVLVDGRMPGLDGMALTRRIRKSSINGRVPIAMLTGATGADIMAEGFANGVTMFLSKPVDRERVRRVVNLLRAGVPRERRKFVRVPLQATVHCEGPAGGMDLNTIDVSEEGAFLEHAGAVSGNIELTFALPTSEEPVHVTAEVLGKDRLERARVRFIQPSDRVRKAIQEYARVYQEGGVESSPSHSFNEHEIFAPLSTRNVALHA